MQTSKLSTTNKNVSPLGPKTCQNIGKIIFLLLHVSTQLLPAYGQNPTTINLYVACKLLDKLSVWITHPDRRATLLGSLIAKTLARTKQLPSSCTRMHNPQVLDYSVFVAGSGCDRHAPRHPRWTVLEATSLRWSVRNATLASVVSQRPSHALSRRPWRSRLEPSELEGPLTLSSACAHILQISACLCQANMYFYHVSAPALQQTPR